MLACSMLRQTIYELWKKTVSTVISANQFLKGRNNQVNVLLLKLILILLILSNLQVANATRNIKEKTNETVWIEVSWARFGSILANLVDGLGNDGVCCYIIANKLQLLFI